MSSASKEIALLVGSATQRRGPAADFTRAQLDELNILLGLDPLSTCAGACGLMRAVVTALAEDAAIATSPSRFSRCWVQLVNRVASPFGSALRAQGTGLLEEIEWIEQQLASVDDPSFVLDVKAGLAAATVWQWLDDLDDLAGVRTADPVLAELMILYGYRYRFAAVPILDLLAGHVNAHDHPIKAAFLCFAHQLLGDSQRAVDSLRDITVSESALPLSAAKLISYSLAVASISDTGTSGASTARAPAELREPFQVAVAVWESHGADEQLYRARASLGAVLNDAGTVNESINAAVDLLRHDPTATPDRFIDLMQYRSDLMARLDIAKELSGVAAIKADAEAALGAARDTATQVPTIVGLFTAVIALVVGSAQVAQGLDVQGRVLVVSSLGVVLLGFVVALAGVTSYISNARKSLLWFSVFLGTVAACVGGLLTVLYVVAGA